MRIDELEGKSIFDSQELNNLGLESYAYVKAVRVDGQTLHAVFAADGTPLTVVNERALAFATILQHELEAVSVH
ncbi:MAG: DUF1150 family protein [Alphaproteobacteria bacterium]|nr:DUF1150 family protein [Alphaproteobacteria bacterium]